MPKERQRSGRLGWDPPMEAWLEPEMRIPWCLGALAGPGFGGSRG